MRRGFRLIIGFLIALFLIIIIIITSLIVFIDPNQLKPVLIDEVQKRSHYQLRIDGDLSWSFYPRIGIKINHMQLLTANPNKPNVFLDLKNIAVSTDLFALLKNHQQLLGEINIEQALLGKITLEDVHVNLHWQNQVLLLEPIKARLYDGTMTGTAEGRDLNQSMTWHWYVQCKDVNINALLQDLSDQAKLILSGLAQVNFQGMTAGRDKQALLNHLNGKLSFNLQRGVLEGIDINYLIQKVSALVRERRFVLEHNEGALIKGKTAFNQFIGTANIRNGIVSNDDLLLNSANFSAKAAGKINLLTESIDYRLQVWPTHITNISWSIPIIIDGDLRRPSVRLDLVTLNALIAKEQLDKAKIKIKENLPQLKEKAQKFIDHLLR